MTERPKRELVSLAVNVQKKNKTTIEIKYKTQPIV